MFKPASNHLLATLVKTQVRCHRVAPRREINFNFENERKQYKKEFNA